MNRHLDPKWWHDMKAVICDFCGKATPTDEKGAMAYDVSIFQGDGFEAETELEKGPLFNADDLCPTCAKAVKSVLVAVQAQLSGKKSRAGKLSI
jgi:hypothetical protein